MHIRTPIILAGGSLALTMAAFLGCAAPTMVEAGVPFDGGVATCAPACSGKTPTCDPRTHHCVACLIDSACLAGNICRGGACVPGCSAQRACSMGTCNLDGGVCLGCAKDTDCKDAKLPFCDASTGHCGPCDPKNDRCPQGTFCDASNGSPACVAGCRNKDQCANADGGTNTSDCCAHTCVETFADNANCGACGTSCDQGTCCGGGCRDTLNDPSHCGSCDFSCNLPNATPSCSSGNCVVLSCNNGWGNCDFNPGNGCESHLNDSNNCGSCGNSCIIACLQGSCFPF